MNTEQCKDCYYWRSMGWNHSGALMCCHFLMWEGKRRQYHLDTCLSKRQGKGRRTKNWPMTILDGSIHDGYEEHKRRR